MTVTDGTGATDRLYVGGAWTEPSGAQTIPVENPASGEIIARVPAGTPADIDAAAAAARGALERWSGTEAEERRRHLARLRDLLDARRELIARTITAEVGTPLGLSKRVQVGLPITVLGSYVDLLATFAFEESAGNSLIIKEPIGVVAAITPWNYPLHQAVAKVAPSLAAGCTVVLKPSPLAPLSLYLLAEAVDEAGFPGGVFNLVPGPGLGAGEHLAAHPQIDMVSFTGSTRAGRRVSELAAPTVKRVALELGGKSANVVLPDADLHRAVHAGVANAFLNSGQTCTAWTRLLVHRSQHDEAAEMAGTVAAGYTVGDPLDDATRLGPLVSAQQLGRVRSLIEAGMQEGARLVVGGPEPVAELPHGHFVRPTVFAAVGPDMRIAQEEIFGPVLGIIPYDDEEDAARIANHSVYGLAGAVWSADRDHAIAFARRMQTGQVAVNGGPFNPVAPFGGYKQSGNGRELGRYGLEEYLQPKALQL